MSSIYCLGPIPDFLENLCANEKGRIIAIALMRSDHTVVDPTNLSQWQQAIADGTVDIIRNVRGLKPKSTPEDTEGFGRQATQTVNRNFSLEYKHPDVVGNEDYYDALNFFNGYTPWFYTPGKLIWRTGLAGEAVANIDADYTIEEGLNSQIMWEVAATWIFPNMPQSNDASGLGSIFE